MPDVTARRLRTRRIGDSLVTAAALALFALFSHRGWPLFLIAAAGLIVAAFAIQRSFGSMREAAHTLGLSSFPRKAGLLIPAACAAGIGLGIFYRGSFSLPIFPRELRPFVAVACLIGGAEEIVYRGWMQGSLRVLGRPAAVGVAAVAHAAYKAALFLWPSVPISVDFAFLIVWTVAGGIVFGVLREASESVVPPCLGHMTFDILVYGAIAAAPWWVWT
jgi:hypothetical protein